MIKSVYSVYDRKAGQFNHFFESVNDDTAIRDFNRAYQGAELSYLAPDVDLYCVGSFDYTKGIMICNENNQPRFVARVGDN